MEKVEEELLAYRKEVETLLLHALRDGDYPDKYTAFMEGQIYVIDYTLSIIRENQSPPNGSQAV